MCSQRQGKPGNASGETEEADGVVRYRQRNRESMEAKLCCQALSYIRRNFTRPISVDDVAEHLSLSSRHLTRVLRGEWNITPGQLLFKVRMEEAKTRLCSEVAYSVKEVAYDCGFSNPSYFSLCYRRHFGRLPSAEVDP